jgi:hypothetical protein
MMPGYARAPDPPYDPPPSPDDYVGDEFGLLLADLAWRHGGVDRLSPVQRELCGSIVVLMINMRAASPSDLVKHAEALSRLITQLPPVRSQRYQPPTVTDGMSLQQMTNLYSRMCGDPDLEAFVGVQDVTDQTANLGNDAQKWQAAQPAPAPEPSQAPAPPQPATPSTADPVDLGPAYIPPPRPPRWDGGKWSDEIVPPAPEPPADPDQPGPFADPRLRAFGLTTYSGAG